MFFIGEEQLTNGIHSACMLEQKKEILIIICF